MDKWTVCACVVLLAGAALALPAGPIGFAEEDSDSDVEVVGPARGGSRAVARDDVSPFDLFGSPGFGFLRPGGLPGFGSFRPVDRRGDGNGAGAQPGGFIHPFIVNPMSDFMKQMNDMMTAMRRQMDEVLHRLPAEGHDWSNKGNTTSTTKVIDGHVVTVNDTTIADGGDDNGSVIHIRVVDVHPSEDPTSVEGTDAPATGDKDDSADKDAEDLEEDVETGPRKQHSDNEIPKKRSVRSPAAARPQAPRRGDISMAAYQDDGDDTQQAHVPVFGPGDYGQQRTVPVFGRGDFQQQQSDSQQQTVPVFGRGDFQQQQSDSQQQTVPVFGRGDFQQQQTDSQQQTVPVFGRGDFLQQQTDSQQKTVPVFGATDSQQTVPVFRDADSQQQTVSVFGRGDFQQQQTVPVFGVAESQQQTVPVFRASDSQQQTVPVFGPDYSQQQQQMRMPVFASSGVQQQQQPQRGQMRMMDRRPQRPGYNQVEVFDANASARQGDLSRDTLVNSLLEQQHSRAGLIMIDPDAELMDVHNGKVVATYVPAPRRAARRTP